MQIAGARAAAKTGSRRALATSRDAVEVAGVGADEAASLQTRTNRYGFVVFYSIECD